MNKILDEATLDSLERRAVPYADYRQIAQGEILALIDNVRRLKEALAIALVWVGTSPTGIDQTVTMGEYAKHMARIRELVGE